MTRSGASAAVSVERFFQLSLLGLVTSGYLAVAGSGYLDAPTIVLTAAGLILRALFVLNLAHFRISERLVTAVTLAYIGFYPLDYLFLSRGFLEATVHLVFFLAVVKILTAKANRDYLYLATIAFVELLAAAILSVNLNFFVFLALYLVFAMAAFTSSEIRRAMQKSDKTARTGLRFFHARLAGHTAVITLGILALTGGFFFLLPRTADAAFRHLISHRYYLPGFSNQVTLGQIGEIQQQSRPVMHVRVYNDNTRLNLKWRGAALTEFDGRKWFNSSNESKLVRVESGTAILADDRQRLRRGRRITYRVDLNAIDSDVLFLAGLPEVLNLGHAMLLRTATDSYRLGYVPSERLRYEAYSFLEPDTGPAEGFPEIPFAVRKRYLQLPAVDPRIPALAKKISAGERTDADRARAIETYLRESYGYTLELLSKEAPDPLAHFLFERKKGHCEYFASAMTVMLRTLDIPARLVTGFQGGTLNPVSDLYVIRASDAHSWVETYLPGRGWTVYDPTPPDLRPRSTSLWALLSFYADAAETFWQEWVLSYDLGRQVTLAQRIERSGRRFGLQWLDRLTEAGSQWQKRARLGFVNHRMAFMIGAALLVFAFLLGPRMWRWLTMRNRVHRLRRGRASVADATLLYNRMLEILRRRGYQKPSWFTPQEFALSLPATEMGILVEQFTSAYNAIRFGGRLEFAPELSVLLDRLERRKK